MMSTELTDALRAWTQNERDQYIAEAIVAMIPYHVQNKDASHFVDELETVAYAYHELLLDMFTIDDAFEFIGTEARGKVDLVKRMADVASAAVDSERVGGKAVAVLVKARSHSYAFNRTKQLGKDRAVKIARAQAGLMIADITATDQKRLQRIIANGIRDGKTRETIAKNIIETLRNDSMTQPRANLIARNEINLALNQGAYLGAQDANLRFKRWVNVGDDHVTPGCRGNSHQGQIGIDDVFESGHPVPPRFPGCRCTGLYNRNKVKE